MINRSVSPNLQYVAQQNKKMGHSQPVFSNFATDIKVVNKNAPFSMSFPKNHSNFPQNSMRTSNFKQKSITKQSNSQKSKNLNQQKIKKILNVQQKIVPPAETQKPTPKNDEGAKPQNQPVTSPKDTKNSKPVTSSKTKETSKSVKKAKASETSKNDGVKEIYKNPEPIFPSEESTIKTNKNNTEFNKVTQELANIIKNFQQQIQNVTTHKMEEIPSAMIQPKIKEYFKFTPNPVTNIVEKKEEVPKKETQEAKVSKTSSVKTFSNKSNEIRRFNSLTLHNLTPKKSNASRLSIRSSIMNIDPLKVLKEEVQKAMRLHKTFTVRGHYAPIRKALAERGWVEKYHPSYKDYLSTELKKYKNYSIAELLPLMKKDDLTSLCKNLIKSKLLGGYQVDFYWGISNDAFRENPDKIKLTTINKLKRDIFSYTNKQGLCDASKISYWYQKSNVSKLNHPRSYALGKNGDLECFIEDFHVTAAMSLLKWVVKMNESKECKLISHSGTIPLEAFDFALNECCKFIKKGRHDDIDVKIPPAMQKEWNQFLEYFYKLAHYNNHFNDEGKETEDSLVRKSNYVLNNMKGFYPFVDMDGMMNIWILKPVASSRGRGIHMCRTLQYILKTVKQNVNTKYIIQKYIERPLLVYNTKFDIRQWFLISNCCPLTIWMYKQSYLRFSTQTYNLRKLHESIHLTNNSVQCKYKNASMDAALPVYNMWDSTEFQRYLSNIGYPDAFNNIIYQGMKQSIIAAVLMHQEKMVTRRNCFEFYGADFILTEDFQPWLLEINSNPALHGSTPVTARMCPKVLEDVIKVVVDYPHNSKASTGLFEMVYKEQLGKLPPSNGSLVLKGSPLHNSYFCNVPQQEKMNRVMEVHDDYLKSFGDEIKKTLANLLRIIHNEKHKRGYIKK